MLGQYEDNTPHHIRPQTYRPILDVHYPPQYRPWQYLPPYQSHQNSTQHQDKSRNCVLLRLVSEYRRKRLQSRNGEPLQRHLIQPASGQLTGYEFQSALN